MKKKTILTPLLVSKLVITTFLWHYKYTTHWSLFSPYLTLNTLPLLKQKPPTLFSSLFLFWFSPLNTLQPWKMVCLGLISQLSENVYLFHGKTLMFFALLSLLELVVFSLAMTLVNNKTKQKSKLSYSILTIFLSLKKTTSKNLFSFFQMKQPFPLFLTIPTYISVLF